MKFAIFYAAIVTAALGCAGALSAARASAPKDPASDMATVAPLQYQSPFRDYRPLGEDKNTAWKDANDTVRTVGGWRVYAREAAEANKAREDSTTAPTKPLAPPATPKPAVTPAQAHEHGG